MIDRRPVRSRADAWETDGSDEGNEMFNLDNDSKHDTMAPRRRAAFLLGAIGVMAAGIVAVAAPGAFAVGGDCSAYAENVPLTGPDGKRAAASCKSLQGDSKAQGVLDMTAALDEHTAWFTALNVTYRSDYAIGPNNGAYYKIAHV
jgi:hypothetical protein